MLWTNDLENLYLEIVGCSLVKGNFVSLLPWSSLRVIVSKNQRNRGHGQKSISLILCQFEGLGK